MRRLQRMRKPARRPLKPRWTPFSAPSPRAQLSRRFSRYKGHAPKTGDADAWHWQMYQHYYSEMKSDRQRGLGRMFWEIFRQVYDREMRSKTLESQFGSAPAHDL